MNLVFKIAKNEFRYLFYSPIAWFLLIVFFVQCAIFYTNPVYDSTNFQDIMIKNNPGFKAGGSESLTFVLFLRQGIFLNVIRNLYLFLPLLTMGLINREVNNSTIKLLYSSPARLRQIVFGKYLGIMLYNLLLISIVGIFMVTACFNIKDVDYGLLLSAALGFYLIVCAYSAIGLLMSSITNYQIVSALGTLTSIFVLSRIGDLWQQYDLVRDLTYFLSLQNRTVKMLTGLITSKDVIYFIAVSGMFIAFTLINLKNDRQAKPWYIRAGRYIGVLAVTLLIGYFSSRPALTGYWDTTATKTNTIHPRTQQFLKEMGDTALEVTLYTNLLGTGVGHGLPEARNNDYLTRLWEPYLRFKPDIKFNYEYYYDTDAKGTDSAMYKFFPGKSLPEIAKENAAAFDVDLSDYKTPQQMRKIINLQPEAYRVVMQLKYKGRTEMLRTFDDPFFWPGEMNANAAFKILLRGKKPKIAFVTGELERSIYKTGDREYAYQTAMKASRSAMVNIGFDVDTLNLAASDIPVDIDVLVIADPKVMLSYNSFGKLRNYINQGGNMLILGEPGKQHVLNPILERIGIKLMNGQLVQPSYDETPDKVTPYLAVASVDLAEERELFVLKNLIRSDNTFEKFYLLMPGATGLVYGADSGFSVKPLAITEPFKTWLKAGPLVTDSTLPDFNSAEGDIREDSFTTGAQLTRQINSREQRIIVCSDADFVSNSRASDQSVQMDRAFYSWLVYNEFPVYTPRTDPKDTIYIITSKVAAWQKIVYVWVLPSLILLSGVIILIRRKRK